MIFLWWEFRRGLRSAPSFIMKIKLHVVDWLRLGLNDPDRKEVARAGFYLGFGFAKIQRMLDYGSSEDRAALITSARLLGLSDEDTIDLDTQRKG